MKIQHAFIMVRWKILSWFGKRKLLRFDSEARQHSYEVVTEILSDVHSQVTFLTPKRLAKPHKKHYISFCGLLKARPISVILTKPT